MPDQRLVAWHHVPDQARVASAVLPHGSRSPLHYRMAPERLGDLGEFHPEAAHLNLIIGSAYVLKLTVRTQPGKIASPEHALTSRGERTCDEPFGRQARSPEVAARKTKTGYVELAVAAPPGTGASDRSRTYAPVFHVGTPMVTSSPHRAMRLSELASDMPYRLRSVTPGSLSRKRSRFVS